MASLHNEQCNMIFFSHTLNIDTFPLFPVFFRREWYFGQTQLKNDSHLMAFLAYCLRAVGKIRVFPNPVPSPITPYSSFLSEGEEKTKLWTRALQQFAYGTLDIINRWSQDVTSASSIAIPWTQSPSEHAKEEVRAILLRVLPACVCWVFVSVGIG